MSGDVSIPAATAKALAAWLRGEGAPHTAPDARWADLLDPRPSLRDAVADAIDETCGCNIDSHRAARAYAALAVVRDHIAALTEPREAAPMYRAGYLDARLAALVVLGVGAES